METDSTNTDMRSVGSYLSRRYRESATGSRSSLRSRNSSIDRFCDRLNDRLIDKMVEDKEREDRKNNIVIRGIKTGKVTGVEWVQKFLREKIGTKIKIVSCRKSGDVLMAKVENEEKKREIITNKCKLGKERIFIENNLMGKKKGTKEN